VLEVNEEINLANIDENIQQVRQEYILYYLQANSDADRYKYLKAVKGALRKIDRVTQRNLIDLHRNIENTFKTEPNYKIKLAKLERQKEKLLLLQALVESTDRLVTEDEPTFFQNAADEELRYIVLDLRKHLGEARQNMIEVRKQIIEYINQVKYHSNFIAQLRKVKYLRDQYELRGKTNLVALLQHNKALVFEPKPAYSLNLSLDGLRSDEVYALIRKVSARKGKRARVLLSMGANLSAEALLSVVEKEVPIDLMALKNNFVASGNHLFDFVMQYNFAREVGFAERVTLYCQVIAIYEDELLLTEKYQRHVAVEGQPEQLEYALVYPK
jgi:hypothetical protein